MNATTTTTTTSAEVSPVTLLYRQRVGLLAAHATALALARAATAAQSSSNEHQDGVSTQSDGEGAAAKPEPPSHLPSYQVAQYLFQGKGRHPGYVPASLVSQQLAETRIPQSSSHPHDNPSSAGTRIRDVFLPCCCNCGFPLQPGYDGTSLRLVRTTTTTQKPMVTRSKRRRASRKLAQSHRRHQKSPKPLSRTAMVSSVSSPSLLSNLGKFSSNPTAPVNATHFKNALVIRCGSCRSEGTLPGLARKLEPPAPPSRERTTPHISSRASAASLKRTASQAPHTGAVRPITRGPPTAARRNGDDSGDFLRLPPPPRPHHDNPPTHQPLRALASASKTTKATAPPQQPQQQRVLPTRRAAKKQNKNKHNPSNKLMNFLSSLND